MAEPLVTISREPGLVTVTLNRPNALNALNHELRTAFTRLMLELARDPEVQAIVLTGAGRAFCAGLDLKEMDSEGPTDPTNVSFITVVEEMQVPVIAAVNGYAITGGFELVLACDLVIAAESAQFADTHARVGVMPGGGISQRLARAVGIRKAKELSFTGNYLTAAQAFQLGLVNQVVPDGQALAAALELGRQILSSDPIVVRQMKRLIDMGMAGTMAHGLELEQDFFRAYNRAGLARNVASRREAVQLRGRAQAARSHNPATSRRQGESQS